MREKPLSNQTLMDLCGGLALLLHAGVGTADGLDLLGQQQEEPALTKLLTDLDQMRSGDCFFLYVLGEKYTYEVDQVLTVKPDQVEALLPVDGETLVTLVTCTPYGVNTHRLFVRGHLIQVELSPE